MKLKNPTEMELVLSGSLAYDGQGGGGIKKRDLRSKTSDAKSLKMQVVKKEQKAEKNKLPEQKVEKEVEVDKHKSKEPFAKFQRPYSNECWAARDYLASIFGEPQREHHLEVQRKIDAAILKPEQVS